jgi:hypothetical protein
MVKRNVLTQGEGSYAYRKHNKKRGRHGEYLGKERCKTYTNICKTYELLDIIKTKKVAET